MSQRTSQKTIKKAYLDTNFILRLSLEDIESQYLEAKETLSDVEKGNTEAHLSLLVVNEFCWISENYYNVPRKKYIPWLMKFLLLDKVKIVEVKKDLTIKVLKLMLKKNLDLTDLYLYTTRGNKTLLTFDKKLKKLL
ncbi:MAG: hypothetical protein A2700_00435 [Candidatus Blackburnbacteria bacterium RIFCSPHIGHO2_01_FULL_44_64]|uniref:PIN domain-containing protein n=1 Tax=Candidatus Blackburnbacteria bacterium RIFCSPHIGHO2_02_FULL_44_20 TaxID=1797516 RepID=A0A1G1V5Q0_9BACT|nr:MAG: hypothetical protein A2700_00435 [Candidatus Blackburnbacteria bacterium RIFCSPHIGHO2_01_FULL_44_64]OGY10740.1 MAG: hypothetical protein A3D26_02775 [Candidatus Blackburnbacteria bacterium RIFCSPHIGHO2_02_FULL_44_20]OGY11906.1 MAG: hypothetical protein A3E16_03900 [Candidatus Blackburnbacteria bacterium RIFCSPHIGHO2_12_FULL_44_25]OGY13629.1 MAG: hypothetical protein A3A62_00100 [Candidatus Blackburnbacteria bacterium RIFCSPLOWO2_01_FULL_44_43]OGY17078.1 MAG: hypothetical protein A3H88_0